VDLTIAYVDGSCLGNPGPGGWAVKLIKIDPPRSALVSGQMPSTTNNLAELEAVYRAICECGPNQSLELHTDSQLVIGWLSQGWERNDPECGAKLDEIEELIASKMIHLFFVKSQSKSSEPNHRAVDRLAKVEAHLAKAMAICTSPQNP